MPKHKLSGAQRRKKQKNDEKVALKSKELMSKSLYSKKVKTDDTESESEPEDDSRDEGSYQLFAENEEDSMDQEGEDTRDPDPNNDSDGKNEEIVEDLPIPAVLSFFDVGFLKFDQTAQRPIMLQSLRTETIVR